jgi:4-amino-4-deoxy-L-arabinose transferase-like glycosyltransferase
VREHSRLVQIPHTERQASPSSRLQETSSSFGAAGVPVATRPVLAGASRLRLRRSHAAALVIALVMCFAGIFPRGLWTPDEPREAEIGREMLANGFSAQPMLDGEPFLEKPPLYPWMMAASYAAFGVSPGPARVPAALCSIGSMLVAYWLGRRAGGRAAGLFAAAVLATFAKFAEVSHFAINDAALTLFVGAGHLAFLVARDREREKRKTLAFIAIGACTALAFLTKALIGPVLLLGPPIVAAAIGREWRFLRHALPRATLWCALFLVALGLPWVLALAHTGGWTAVRVCLVDNTIGRSLPGVKQEFGHEARWYYYFTTLPVDMLPWTLALPALAMSGVLRASWRGGRARWLALACVAGIALLSIPASKRGLYVVPLMPAMAAAMGAWLSRAGTRDARRVDRATTIALLGTIAVVCVAVAGVAVWIAMEGALPQRIADGVAYLRDRRESSTWIAAACVAAVIGLVAAWCSTRPRSRAAACASLALATFLFWHAVLTPFIDPLKDMRDGTRELVARVPENEPLLGVSLDETTRAIIPYYSGRLVENAASSEHALAKLSSGSARHLFVMPVAEPQLDPALRARLHLVEHKMLNANRSLDLFAFE